MWALGWLLLAVSAGHAAVPPDDDTLVVGEPLALSLGQQDHPVPGLGAARILRMAPGPGGALTLQVESLDGDVLMGVLGSDGRLIAEDDDGGIETDARLVLPEVTAGKPLRLLVAFKHERAGEVTVTARAGDQPLATGAALELARGRWKALRGERLLAGGDPATGCTQLIEAANLLFDLEHFSEVMDALSRAEPLLEVHATPIRRAYARAFLASSLYRLGRMDEAEPRLEACVAEARVEGLPAVEMMARSDLGRLRSALGKWVVAESDLSRALELAQQLGDRKNELVLHTQLAGLLIGQGRLDEARAACEAAEFLAGFLDDGPRLADALAARADWHRAQWDIRQAEAALDRAVLLPLPPIRRANLMGQLGDVRLLLSDPRGAAYTYWKAAQIAAELDDRALLARIVTGLGRAQLALDEPLAAKDSFDAALVILEDLDVPGNRLVCMEFRAESLQLVGQEEEARSEAERAVALAKQLGNERFVSQALTVLRAIEYRSGHLDRLEDLTREQLERLQDGSFRLLRVRTQADLAAVHMRRGHLEEAEEQATAAMDAFVAMGLDRERPAEVAAVVLTEVALSRGDLPGAEEAMVRLAEIARSCQLRATDPDTASAWRAVDVLRAAGSLAHDLTALRLSRATDPDAKRAAVDKGLRAAGEWKASELAAGLQTIRRKGGDMDATRLLQERRRVLGERDGVISTMLRVVSDGRSADEVKALVDHSRALDDRARALGVELAEHSPRDGLLDNISPWGLVELRASLGPGEIYLEFVEGSSRLYVFAISHDTADLHDLGTLTERRAEVAVFVDGISDREHLAEVGTVARTGSALWNALLGAVFPVGVPAETRLVVVPSTSLATLPFEALVLSSASHPSDFDDLEFLLDRNEVVYASSGPVFAALQSSGPRSSPGRALVLGDPIYDSPSTQVARGSRDPRQLGFSRLPGTREEALGLARILLDVTGAGEGARSALDHQGSSPTSDGDALLDLPSLRLVLGRQLTPEVLRGDLREFGLIHCATHGHMDIHDPGLTGLALTPSESDDGFVTTSDVLEFSLDADLAVLSACETARGRERAGEGTLSLSRAFLYAGARSVVSSMWQVDDRETERTMEVFYGGLLRDGLTVPASLRAARLAIRHGKAAPDAFRGVGRGSTLGSAAGRKQKGRPGLAGHPYFWAPFVYVGPTALQLSGGRTPDDGR